MRLYLIILIFLALNACGRDHGLDLSSNWQAETLAQWHDTLPDMMVLSDDQNMLFITGETRANTLAPSLLRLDLSTKKKEIIFYGLDRADGLKLDKHGDLWLGEERPDGLIWKIKKAEYIPSEQHIDRHTLSRSHESIQAIFTAGKFSHEGLAFSKGGRFLYLGDEWVEGCLYRFDIKMQQLQVLHRNKGWLNIKRPEDARIEAKQLDGRLFVRLEDMETLPDGRILMAETGRQSQQGRIWLLNDLGDKPTITSYLKNKELDHPDNLEWDAKRNWLWITDDHIPSQLWVWNGELLTLIASHDSAEITGVESGKDGSIYINLQHLQHRFFGADLTLRLTEKQ